MTQIEVANKVLINNRVQQLDITETTHRFDNTQGTRRYHSHDTQTLNKNLTKKTTPQYKIEFC